MKKIILFIFAFCVFSKTFSQDSIPDVRGYDKFRLAVHNVLFPKESRSFSGLNLGVYLPTSQDNILGIPLLLGVTSGWTKKKNTFSLSADLIIPTVENSVPLEYEGKSIMVKNGGGAQITLDYSRDFWQKNKFLFSGVCGTGYKMIGYAENKDYKMIKHGWVLTSGINISYFGDSFLQLRIQYVVNYHFTDNANSNLEGNYFMVKFVHATIPN